jgi:histidyl-tRNA synthetase
MKFELAKGVRDFGPDEQIIRQELMQKLRAIFERYGFSPMETPIIERLDTLTAKFGAGEGTDVMKEIFRLTDQGERNLGLKFDQTVPLARYISLNPTIKLPFKRYIIDRSFRDGPIRLGRYREFYQCDIDTVGCGKMTAEAEIIELTIDAFKTLDFDITLEINNRKLLFGLMYLAGIAPEQTNKAAIAIDKLKKIGSGGVIKEMTDGGIAEEKAKQFVSYLANTGTTEDIFAKLTEIAQGDEACTNALDELKKVFAFISDEAKEKVKLDLTLARGLNYYTGTIFEAFLNYPKGTPEEKMICSSVAGGGRYDDMIGQYVGRGQYPAIGFSFGLAPILDAMKLSGFEVKKTTAQVLIIAIHEEENAKSFARILRFAGINTMTDLNGKSISKNLDYAEKYKIPYAIFIGEEEAKKNKGKLRDLTTGKEELLSTEEIIKKLTR